MPGFTSDKLNDPNDLYYDEINQNLYISCWSSHTIVRWHIGNSTGTVIAGSSGVSGSNSTLLFNPQGKIFDQWNNLYVVDRGNNRIQLFCNGTTAGVTIAGSTSGGSSLSVPYVVQLDSQMNLYVSERDRAQVSKFNKWSIPTE